MTNIVEPRVTLLAHTKINDAAISEWMDIQDFSTDAETLLTMAGRNCYRSFHRPNEATRNDADYLQRTLSGQGHWSISEHATATLYFTGVSRAFLTELTRHRHLSFSVESQRFINAGDANIVLPPAIRDRDEETQDRFIWSANQSIAAYEDTQIALRNLPKKQRNEAARGLLPNCIETRMVVTGNLRAWHEVIQRRTQPDADAEIQEVMRLAARQLHTVSPVIFP
ncbi:thymidylate synthase, flavin-dependent [Corynebacterium sp. KPL1824]|mgnify:CR=1 FL=1|uniref:FAD-dependent thymidylate synthase n=1 Tax=Corynebacterium sp. KPL1824 TaxID=1203561 RepID=UPI0003B883A5|nr:FAD-dependent thymidylate synthase [Corynebacterium sp. KPL1824]ERS51237.1 thymidylate synthase, flavin-dependent [Corynebacterium sp. KPL1824]DAQ14439.1 MAG TPA: Thymidylate synthase complementing protein [Caudoviricetes sp.]